MPLKNVEEEALVRVGPGTASGEVFRRYWLPVECSANLGGGRAGFTGARNPLRVRVLGEDLVLFRDASGKPGLLAEHCSHRGTSLYYGRVEDHSIRCLYHGWAYDREGNCTDTPAEPPDSNLKYTVKHPSYPCVEVGGLIFAYMGPPEKKPDFPQYAVLFRDDGLRVTGNGGYVEQCNVFQAMLDNNLDYWHLELAHDKFRGTPPTVRMHWGHDGQPPTPHKVDRTPWGLRHLVLKDTETPGHYYYTEVHMVWPCQRCNFPLGRSMKWAVPVDDYRTRWFVVDFFEFDKDGKPTPEAIRAMNSPGPSVSYAVGLPDDWAEQVGGWWNYGHPWRQGNLWEDEVITKTQGPPERHYLPDWEKWHLATSDQGLMAVRQAWREQIERVKQGLDPVGVTRGQRNGELIHIPADDLYGLTWEDGMRLLEMTAEERLEEVKRERATGWRYVRRSFG